MSAYHVTTPKKLARYEATGYIMPPVRWWTTEYSARRWMKHTGRTILLQLDAPQGYPLPIKGGAKWSDSPVASWTIVDSAVVEMDGKT